jgi:hypothetical protein
MLYLAGLILKLNPESFEIQVEKAGEKKASSYTDFLTALPLTEARFAVFDHEVRTI